MIALYNESWCNFTFVRVFFSKMTMMMIDEFQNLDPHRASSLVKIPKQLGSTYKYLQIYGQAKMTSKIPIRSSKLEYIWSECNKTVDV